DVPHGRVESLAIVVQEPPPAGRRSKSTCVVSGSDEADSHTGPLRFCPGSASVGAGARLSTVTLRTAEVVELPARSVTTTWMVAAPSEPPVVSQLSENGAVVAVPRDGARPKPPTDAIGEVASDAGGEIATVSATTWPSVGAPTAATFGLVLSTTLSARSDVVTLSALSVMTMRRS